MLPPHVLVGTAPHDAGDSASEGSGFDGWAGCDSQDGNFCGVTMNTSKSITASFTVLRFSLTVEKTGIGGGTVTSTPAGINCGSTCGSTYDYGTVVTLTATPAFGSFPRGTAGRSVGGSCTSHEEPAVSANFVACRRWPNEPKDEPSMTARVPSSRTRWASAFASAAPGHRAARRRDSSPDDRHDARSAASDARDSGRGDVTTQPLLMTSGNGFTRPCPARGIDHGDPATCLDQRGIGAV